MSISPINITVLQLPVALPTWNVLLAMGWQKRKKVRDILHRLVLAFTPVGKGSLTLTEFQQKRQLMACDIAEYYRTIRPNKSPKSGILKKSVKMAKKNKPLSSSIRG